MFDTFSLKRGIAGVSLEYFGMHVISALTELFNREVVDFDFSSLNADNCDHIVKIL